MKTWLEITNSDKYKKLPDKKKLSVRERYLQNKKKAEKSGELERLFDGIKKQISEINKVEIPKINLPEVIIPEIKIPEIKIPEINIPEIKPPEINIPEIKLPEINLNNDDLNECLIDLSKQIALIKYESAQPVRQWAFDIIRDGEGYIKRIEAKESNGTTIN